MNVLFLVWDSARVDYVNKHAQTLNNLANQNISFSHAITPATWSLPAHCSLFSGNYPHEHGIFRLDHFIDNLPLADRLDRQNFRRVGISGNGFASHRYGFDHSFDEFYYTRQRFPPFSTGLPAQKMSFELRNRGKSKQEIFTTLIQRTLAHQHRSKSLVNVGTFLWDRMLDVAQSKGSSLAQRFQVEYSPDRNTEKIIEILDRVSERSEPFFLFANYMDCHRPYNPPEEIRQQFLDGDISRSELDRLDFEVARPWRFIERLDQGETIPDSQIELLRKLYAAEVHTVDQHLQQILDALDDRGLREETLIVVTADHGENLGEEDSFNRRRMGHEGSMSEHLTHVPLVIAHPDFSAVTVDKPVSLRHIFDLFDQRVVEDPSTEQITTRMQPTGDEVVLCEYPVVGGEHVKEKYPGASEKSLADRLTTHTVAAYVSNWKVIVDSNGGHWAWNKGEKMPVEAAPKDAIEAAEEAVSQLSQNSGRKEDMGKEKIKQLENLGYI